MSKIKDKIKKGGRIDIGDTKKVIITKSGFGRRITIKMHTYYKVTMEIVYMPFTEKAIVRSIWMGNPNPKGDSKYYLIKNQIRPCTLDDIENWIKKHFQIE